MVILWFKRETPEHKATRLAHEKKLRKVREKAKYKAQLIAAEQEGTAEGLKGKRSFLEKLNLDKIGDGVKKFNEACNIAEEALGGSPSTKREAPKKSRQTNRVQPIVIVLDNKKQKQKKKSTMEYLFGETP